MCKTDLRKNGASFLCSVFTIFFTLLFTYSQGTAQSLACVDLVQVSLNSDCEADIVPTTILQPGPAYDPADYGVTVSGVSGTIVTNPGNYRVTVTHLASGNSCWGNILVEDKFPPQITSCPCPENGVPTTQFSGEFNDQSPSLSVPNTTSCDPITEVISSPTVAFETFPFTITDAGTFDFTVPVPPTGGCNIVYAIYDGAFNPNTPCSNFVLIGPDPAVGYEATADGTIVPATMDINNAGLTPGEYTLAVFVDPSDPDCTCDIQLSGDQDILAVEEQCIFACTELDNILGDPTLAPEPMVNDNCSTVTTQMHDQVIDGPGCGVQTLIRQYIYTDANGNSSMSCIQEFVFDAINVNSDITPPVSPVELNCGVGHEPIDIYNFFLPTLGSTAAYEMAYPTINGLPLDENMCNVIVTKSDDIIPICGPNCSGNNKIVREWTVLDWCRSEIIRFPQLIKAADTEGPTIDVDDLTVSVDPWGCVGNFLLPEPNILHDNCDIDATYTVRGPLGVTIVLDGQSGQYFATNVPKGDNIFTYIASDCCGNETEFDITVSVIDKTPPVAVTIQYIVVTLTNGGDPSSPAGQAKIKPESIDNGSHDGCGPVYLEIRRLSDACGIDGNSTFNNDGHENDSPTDPDDGQFVKFCCADLTDMSADGVPFGLVDVELRVWDDGDMDGVYGSAGDNYAINWSTIRVEDKLAPALLCPPDVTVSCADDCDDLNLVGSATAYSTCGLADVEYTDTDDTNTCGIGTITRRWSITGRPNVFCIQTITKEPETPFNGTIDWPDPMEITCTQMSETGVPTWTAGICDQLAYSLADSDTFLFEDGACFKILNKWEVIDWCQYDPNSSSTDGYYSHIQVIKVTDNEAPDILDCEDQMYEVDSPVSGGSASNETTCYARDLMLTNVADDSGDCASNWLKWNIAVDLWGDGTADYVFSSNVPPFSPFYVSPTSSGQEVKITIPEDVDGSMFNHKVEWKVTDGCGNVSSCETNFMVVDKKAPTPYCINIHTALMNDGTVDLWACDFDLGSFDNCTDQEDLRWTFSSVPPDLDPDYDDVRRCSDRTFTCDDLVDHAIALDVYVWDEKDNYEFCTVMLTLQDNQGACGGNGLRARIEGEVYTETGKMIDDVKVDLVTNLANYPLSDVTAVNGQYAFASNPMYLDYDLSSTKEDDAVNGVTALDLLLIQKHILGIQLLDSPYKVIASDINADDKVSSVDLTTLRKLILGVYDEIPNSTSWRFIDADQTFVNPMNPFPYKEGLTVQDLNNDMMNENMIGIKVGDVNGSATVSLTGEEGVSQRSESDMVFNVLEREVTIGEKFSVSFSATNFVNVNAYQFTLNTLGLEVIDMEGESVELNKENYAILDKNTMTTYWHDFANVSLSVDESVFAVTFLATENGLLSEMLSIGSEKTKAEAYFEGNRSTGIALEFRNAEDTKVDFALFQNQPNPFSERTFIGFILPESGEATLNVFDVTGKLLYSKTQEYSQGYNEVEISRNDLNSTGVMYYQLENGTNVATMKMIEIE